MKSKCKCREKMASILRERIERLDAAVEHADVAGKLADGLEVRARRNESQLVLNTILLEDF